VDLQTTASVRNRETGLAARFLLFNDDDVLLAYMNMDRED